MTAIAPLLSTHLNAQTLVSWEELNPVLQAQIRSATDSDEGVECVAYPQTQDELATILQVAYANRWRILPLGTGSKLQWGGLAPSVDLAVSTAGLTRVVDHAVGDLTVTAEAGLAIATLHQTLTPHRQWLPISPTYPQSTLGGLVATADAGALRQRYGGIRDLLIGITMVRYDGQVAHAGGRVVKNVAGYDLMKLLTGSFGTLGIISEVTFRLYPVPESSETVVLTGTVAAIAQTLQTLRASALTPTAIDLLATETVQALNLGQGMGLMVRFQTTPVSIQQQATQLIDWAAQAGLTGDRLSGEPETHLWHQLQEQLIGTPSLSAIACKIGVLPAVSAIALDKLSHCLGSLDAGVIHAGSGLGMVRCGAIGESGQRLRAAREICEAHGGFLTVLDAPKSLKQAIDVWGYSGNALDAMRRLKQRFDPHSLLSPNRFIAGL
ncbi:MAG: FAD-binding oxidoreductase [Synechococcales cyanobacterium T60_A2020_003]|nr:FAD-binding oxidoreductase [Synechococcales cyanobacterium T60_A2020_003]